MLHHEVRGSGPDLVMVHGWGMHTGIWSDWAETLAAHFRVHLVDLPGHGASDYSSGSQLDDWTAAVTGQVPGEAWWLGWSLGALVALNAARLYPRQVRGLVLVAGTPRFVTAPDWPCAVESGVFDQFAGQLREDVQRTLVRFLSLQVRGSDAGNAALRRLRSLLNSGPCAQPQALSDGLRLLQHSDLRGSLDALHIPLYWLFGARDTLVPAAVAERVPGVCRTVPGAGHAPFLSHPQACTARIREWLLPGSGFDRHAAV